MLPIKGTDTGFKVQRKGIVRRNLESEKMDGLLPPRSIDAGLEVKREGLVHRTSVKRKELVHWKLVKRKGLVHRTSVKRKGIVHRNSVMEKTDRFLPPRSITAGFEVKEKEIVHRNLVTLDSGKTNCSTVIGGNHVSEQSATLGDGSTAKAVTFLTVLQTVTK